MAAVSRIARWAHLVLVALFLVGVVVQFFLAGAGIFDATTLEAHEGLGWALHTLTVVIFVVSLLARLGWTWVGLSFLLLVLSTVQAILPEAGSDWVQAFHPLGALVLYALAHVLLRRDLALVRRRELPPAGATT